MAIQAPESIFSPQTLADMFPPDRANRFFQALLGDAEDGAYDIGLVFREFRADRLMFAFELRQRPGRCLACNLTYGLPQVFSRHPVIDVQALVDAIGRRLGNGWQCKSWRLGRTREISRQLHEIPLRIDLES